MPNTPTNASEQGSSADSTVGRSGLTVGQIGILIIQGFAIFVAFSTFLGRIYFREYSDALNIPESEFQMDVLSYSVISPDVAISGVGVAVFSVIAVAISFKWKSGPNNRRIIFVIGVGLLLYAVSRMLFDLLGGEIPEPGVGAMGFWWLHITASWTLGTALTFSAGASWLTSNPAGDRSSPTRDRRSRGARRSNGWTLPKWVQEAVRAIGLASLLPWVVFAMLTLLMMAILQATLVGRMDANLMLRDAPLVELSVNSSKGRSILNGNGGKLGGDLSSQTFKLIHVGDKFVYMRRQEVSCICPAEAGLESGDPYQYAIPATDIASITYLAR